MNRRVTMRFLFFLCIFILAGCADKTRERVLWPPPPNEPKLEFIDIIVSERSFKKGRWEKGLEKVVGELPETRMRKPMGIASAGDGVVYVADFDANMVRVYDLNQGTLSSYTDKPVFKQPIGLAIDSRQRLYVAASGSSAILVFGADRQPLFSFGSREIIRLPVFLALDEKHDRIYVTDGGNHQVVVFDLAGNHLFSFGRKGGGDGDFRAPQGIAVDSRGRIYVADMLNARIQVFDPEGKFLTVIGGRGLQPGSFEAPRGLAIDSDDNLYVMDGRKATMLIFRTDGALLMEIGGKITDHPLGFSMPVGIWIDHLDCIYIADMMNLRFTIWQYLSSTYLQAHPVTGEELERLQKRVEEVQGKRL